MDSVRQKILDNAHELFAKQGIRHVTMDELAQSLGMSKRTIYEHFKDKRTLVQADAVSFALKLEEKIVDVITSADNVIQGMAKLVDFFAEMLQSVSQMYFSDLKKYYPEAFSELVEKGEVRNFVNTEIVIKKGVEQDVFRNDLNIKLVCFFLNGVVFAKHDEMTAMEEVKFGDFHKDILFPYLYGIATEKGRKLINEELIKYFENVLHKSDKIPLC